MENLNQNLPSDICSGISSNFMGGSENTEDIIVWNHPKEVEFSVKSAYRAISKEEQLNAIGTLSGNGSEIEEPKNLCGSMLITKSLRINREVKGTLHLILYTQTVEVQKKQ